MTAFEGSQTSSEYLQKKSCHRNYSLLPKPEDDVGSMCVCVCVYEWVCGTCVYIYV